MAIAPSVVKAPESKSTTSGRGTTRFLRHDHVFGVYGVVAPGAGHTLAGLKTGYAFAQFYDRAGAGITQRHGLVQAVEGGFDGAQQPLTAGFVQHLFDQVRAGARLAQDGLAGELDQHTFGAGRDQGGGVAHQQHAGFGGRYGHLYHLGEAVTHVLQ